MKIYVITSGSYSDYHICAVATDLDTAAELRELHTTKYDEAHIEEFDTDECAKTLSVFAACMHVFYDTTEDEILGFCRDYCKRDNLRHMVVERYPNDHIMAHESIEYRPGMTDDQIKKIFFDDLAKYKAEKEGVI